MMTAEYETIVIKLKMRHHSTDEDEKPLEKHT